MARVTRSMSVAVLMMVPLMMAGTASATTIIFSDTTPITILDASPATPYPSNIIVSGVTSAFTKMTVSLNNLSHTFPSDVDMLLVGPGGQKFILLSDVIGGPDWVNTSYVLDDAAGSFIPSSGSPVSGTFKPTNYTSGDVFPAPAPAGPYASPGTVGADTLLSVFGVGAASNGTWSLYVVDDLGADVGTMADGWALNFSTPEDGAAVPEPASLLLLGTGLLAACRRKRQPRS